MLKKKKGTRIVDTVEFFPSKLSMPHTSSKDLSSIAALELSNALQNPASASPFSHIGTAQLQALHQLSDIFSAALPSGTTQHAPPLTQNSSHFRSALKHTNSDEKTTYPSDPKRISTTCPASLSEGDPQTGAISKGDT
jgi:hypothetical protein